MILFNQGNTPERSGLITGTLGATNASGIRVIEATFAPWRGVGQHGRPADAHLHQRPPRDQDDIQRAR